MVSFVPQFVHSPLITKVPVAWSARLPLADDEAKVLDAGETIEHANVEVVGKSEAEEGAWREYYVVVNFHYAAALSSGYKPAAQNPAIVLK